MKIPEKYQYVFPSVAIGMILATLTIFYKLKILSHYTLIILSCILAIEVFVIIVPEENQYTEK